ncbi:MAG: NUDIX domain-containing protein [Patescibacteria group bacterium]|jgi:8-oxo-dGTP pyrophosphatase MutT (NUDIX family)
MPKKDHNFNVGLKAFIRKGDSFLALKDAYSEFWDIPGGRIEGSEIDQPVTECLRRELLEELGINLCIEVNELFDVCKFRVQSNNKIAPNLNLFLVFYTATFQSGDIILNEESVKYEWLNNLTYHSCNFGSQNKVVDAYVSKFLPA